MKWTSNEKKKKDNKCNAREPGEREGGEREMPIFTIRLEDGC